MQNWTEDLVEKMRALYLAGHSDSQISSRLAEEDQFYVSRNAIIGKRHRERIAREENSPRPINATKPRRAKVSREIASSLVGKITRALKAKQLHEEAFEQDIPAKEELIEGFRHLSILELDKSTCRYPHGDETITFCGLKPYEGLPYCAHHGRLAYQPPPVRRALGSAASGFRAARNALGAWR
jgi:GcrA cell cycle regulator